MFKYLAIATTCALLSTPVWAKTEEYKLDPLHSSVLIKVNHLGFSSYYLKATNVMGDIELDRKNPAKSDVSVVIQTANIDGNNQQLNTHLRTVDFFDADRYPTITFTSTGIQITGEQKALISGVLTIRGMAQPVVLNATFNKEGENALAGDYRAGFSATTIIKRSDFGMTYGLPALGDEVQLDIQVEAIRQKD